MKKTSLLTRHGIYTNIYYKAKTKQLFLLYNYYLLMNQYLILQMGIYPIILTSMANFKKIQAGYDTFYEHLMSRSHLRNLTKFEDTEKRLKKFVDNNHNQNNHSFTDLIIFIE